MSVETAYCPVHNAVYPRTQGCPQCNARSCWQCSPRRRLTLALGVTSVCAKHGIVYYTVQGCPECAEEAKRR